MRPLVYDCFLFWKEFDLLELRLQELDEVVDYFVLVEATHTFSGQPKPLYFREQQARFAAYAPRIIAVVVDDMLPLPGPWERDFHQRNCIARGLSACRPQDIVLFSDLDEIPRPDKVAAHLTYPGVTAFIPRLYYYYLNCQASRTYPGTCMLPYGVFTEHRLSVQQVRTGDIGTVPHQVVRDGGWHFSFCFGATQIREKIAAYAHQEYNQAPYTDLSHLEAARTQGRDLFRREEMRFEFVPVDASFPRVVQAHPERFAHLVHRGSGAGA